MRAVDLDVADAVLDGDVEGVVSGECVAVGLSVGVGALVTVEAPRLGGLAEEVGRLVALLARLLVKVVEDVDEFGEPLAIGELCGTVRESGAEHHGTIDRGRVGHVVAGESGDLVGHHREQAFADIGVDRVRGDLRAAVLVVVEPRAGLLPQLFGFDLLDEQWAGSVRLAEHLVHIFEDVVPHVDTDLVRELERAHREPHVELRRGVDRLDRRVAGLDDPRGLVHQGTRMRLTMNPGLSFRTRTGVFPIDSASPSISSRVSSEVCFPEMTSTKSIRTGGLKSACRRSARAGQ